MKTISRLATTSFAVAALAAGMSAAAGPAAAAKSSLVSVLAATSCTVYPGSTSCQTGAIAAAGGRIYVTIVKPIPTVPCSYRVRDVTNSRVVRDATFVYGYRASATISGLYSSYRLELYNCAPGSAGFIGDRP
jgi:hypothetical protein